MTSCNINRAHNCPKCGGTPFMQQGNKEPESQVTCDACGTIYLAKDVAADKTTAKPVDLINDLVETAFNDIFRK